MERNELLCSSFVSKIGESYLPEQLIFLDESAKDERSLSRGYGYAFANPRAQKKVVFVRGKRYTILPARTTEGIVAVEIMVGSCDKKKFNKFILSRVVGSLCTYNMNAP